MEFLAIIGVIALLILAKFIYDTFVTGKTEKRFTEFRKENPIEAAEIEPPKTTEEFKNLVEAVSQEVGKQAEEISQDNDESAYVTIPNELKEMNVSGVFKAQLEEVESNPDYEVDEKSLLRIKSFFVPDDISALKFAVNLTYFKKDHSSPFSKHFNLVTPTCKKLVDNIEMRSPVYPSWFYCAYPDVAYWAIKGDGNRIVKNEIGGELNYLGAPTDAALLDYLIEQDLETDDRGSKNKLRNEHLRRIIDLFKMHNSNKPFECATAE